MASETFIVTKVLNLLESNYDVRIFAFTESKSWDRFKVLSTHKDIRDKMRISPLAYRNNFLNFSLKQYNVLVRHSLPIHCLQYGLQSTSLDI